MARRHRALCVLVDVRVDLSQQTGEAGIGLLQGFRQVVGEVHAIGARTRRAADQAHAAGPQLAQIEILVVGPADELRRRRPALLRRCRRGAKRADVDHPRQDVATAVAARQAHVGADRERDFAARLVQFFGELRAGGRCADDQHVAVAGSCSGLR